MTNTCETCMHMITYAELDDNQELNTKKLYGCMITDAETELNDSCLDYEDYCSSCAYLGEQGDSVRCAFCNDGSEYVPDNDDRLVIEL